MKKTNKNLIGMLLVIPTIVLISVFFMLRAISAFAHISPSGCNGSGLGINLFASMSQAHIGDVISYSVSVFNGSNSGPIVCDATNIQASIITPDGQTHPLTLTRTSLSNADSDNYSNVVTYTARSQDITSDGTLAATASDTGVIHQNITDSQGGGNQGLKVFVLNSLHVIKQVVNTGGGTSIPSSFMVHVKKSGVDVAGSPAAGTAAPGSSYSIILGTYTVSEVSDPSYTQSFSGACNSSGTVVLTGGDDKTCTIINTFIPPAVPVSLFVIKEVVNTGGGTAVPSDFSLHVKSGGVDVAGSPLPGASTPGNLYSLPAGTYTVSEDHNASYTQRFSGDCDASGRVTPIVDIDSSVIDLDLSDDSTCIVTNTFISPTAPGPATLHVIKLVINGSGGTAVPADFSVHVKSGGADVTGSPAVGSAAPGTSYSLSAGTYAVSENANSSYAQTFSGACDSSGNVTLSPGNDSICTIVNTDIPPPIAVVPATGGGGGGSGGGGGAGGGGGGGRIVPLIGILKVPSPLALSAGAGSVTYHYTVWNVGGAQALTDVAVTDDKCSPVAFLSGDINSNGKLDPGEHWNYSCTTTLSSTTTNTATAVGHSDDASHQATIATAIATVVVSSVPGFPNTGLLPPLINIVTVPNHLTPFPFGGGDVTYTYTVTNPGLVPMHDVTVTDDHCATVSRTAGDTNLNNFLDPGEAWIYTCSTNVPISTSSITTVAGTANGFTALGYAFATVLVAAPGLPDTGFPPDGNMTVMLLGGLILGMVSFVVVLKKRSIRSRGFDH